MTIVPVLTMQEKMDALKKANELRFEMAEIRKDLKARRYTAYELINRGGETVERMRIIYLLESMPAVGRTKAERIMSELGVGPTKRVQGLGVHQRKALLEYLRNRR